MLYIYVADILFTLLLFTFYMKHLSNCWAHCGYVWENSRMDHCRTHTSTWIPRGMRLKLLLWCHTLFYFVSLPGSTGIPCGWLWHVCLGLQNEGNDWQLDVGNYSSQWCYTLPIDRAGFSKRGACSKFSVRGLNPIFLSNN